MNNKIETIKVRITRCPSTVLWYNPYVGDTFYSYREYDDSYLVRTPNGTSNIIYKTDCEVVQRSSTTDKKGGSMESIKEIPEVDTSTSNIVDAGGATYERVTEQIKDSCFGCCARNSGELCRELSNRNITGGCSGTIFTKVVMERVEAEAQQIAIEPAPIAPKPLAPSFFIAEGQTYKQAPVEEVGTCVGCAACDDSEACNSLSTPDCSHDYIFKLVAARPLQTPKEALTTGRKDDTGKLRYSLIPPYALEQVAKCLTLGANKYAPNNWKYVEGGKERYLDALMRHAEAYRKGEILDADGNDHRAAIVVNAMFLLEFDYSPEFNNNQKQKESE